GLLSGYAGQQAAQTSRSDSSSTNGANPAPPAPQNFQRPPTGNLPGQFGPQGQVQPRSQNGPGFMARPLQMVQRWSNKMAALRQPGPPVDPNPLVRYRPQQQFTPGMRPPTQIPTNPDPWKLSRTQKINRMIRKRRERWYQNAPNGKRMGVII